MISAEEYEGYKVKATSQDTTDTLLSEDADAISKLEAELSIIYSRISFELAEVKDAIDTKVIALVGEGMAVNKSELQAETDTNKGNPVTRRDLEALHKAVDKLGFSCTHRTKVIVAERHKEFSTEEI